MGWSSSHMTHFSAARVGARVRASENGVVSEGSSAHSEGIFEPCRRMALPTMALAFPFSGVPEFLLMPVRISHFQLRSMEAILAE